MAVLAGSVVFALVLAVVTVAAGGAHGRRHRRLGPVSVGVALGVAVVVGMLGLVVASRVPRIGLFGVASLLWVSTVVGGALACFGLLGVASIGRRRGWDVSRPVEWVLAVAGVALVALGSWGSVIEPYRLETVEVSATVSPRTGLDRPLRIGVLADLQFQTVGDHEHRAVRELVALEPDLILIAGDIYQGDDPGFEAELPAIRDLLGQLEAPGGVFLVPGDTDFPSWRIDRVAEGTEVQALHDRVVATEVDGQRVVLAGIALDVRSPSAGAALAELATEEGPGFRLVLAHRPEVVYELPSPGAADLVVAGHTHGGQISVPGFGPLVTLTSVPRHVAAGGLHEVDGTAIFVSTGVGMERGQAPPVRLFVNPTVGLVELVPG